MKCSNFSKKVNAFIENKLTDAENQECQAHLAECETCKEFFEEEKNLTQAFSSAKKVEAPEDYWKTFTPRVLNRIAYEEKNRKSFFSFPFGTGFLIPTAVSALLVVTGYWIGRQTPLETSMDSSPIHFVSDNSTRRAETLFKEMLELFPDRVNWITEMNGKLDFSVSSVPVEEDKKLIPFEVWMNEKNFKVPIRFLIRQGQNTLAKGPLKDGSHLLVTLHLSDQGHQTKILFRRSDQEDSASLEATVKLDQSDSIPLGSMRWKNQLVPLQLIKLPNSIFQTNLKGESAQSDGPKNL